MFTSLNSIKGKHNFQLNYLIACEEKVKEFPSSTLDSLRLTMHVVDEVKIRSVVACRELFAGE